MHPESLSLRPNLKLLQLWQIDLLVDLLMKLRKFFLHPLLVIFLLNHLKGSLVVFHLVLNLGILLDVVRWVTEFEADNSYQLLLFLH